MNYVIESIQNCLSDIDFGTADLRQSSFDEETGMYNIHLVWTDHGTYRQHVFAGRLSEEALELTYGGISPFCNQIKTHIVNNFGGPRWLS